ncbi:MAG TPA: hypothetical protein VGT79_02895 [Xanthomonadaceae bacterium]|nr:hypothetical protein [Xanthomonadaceae bacterium]
MTRFGTGVAGLFFDVLRALLAARVSPRACLRLALFEREVGVCGLDAALVATSGAAAMFAAWTAAGALAIASAQEATQANNEREMRCMDRPVW